MNAGSEKIILGTVILCAVAGIITAVMGIFWAVAFVVAVMLTVFAVMFLANVGTDNYYREWM